MVLDSAPQSQSSNTWFGRPRRGRGPHRRYENNGNEDFSTRHTVSDDESLCWAEMVGADLRVVVMVRNARDMLASTVVRRHFAAWGKQGATLTNAAAALAQQLGLIDPRFFACVRCDEEL